MSLAHKITDYDDPQSIASKLRAKRIKPLLSMIDDVYKKNGSVNILDVGGTKQYWQILPQNTLEEKNVSITLLNVSFDIRDDWDLPAKNKPEDEERFRYLEGDACDASALPDYSFDIVHSNSVVEHVGGWSRMLEYSKEIKRLAKNYYVQTPYFWFPVEPHAMTPFFHWLPEPTKVALIMMFSLGSWIRKDSVSDAVFTAESARLLDMKMFRALFEEADISVERLLFLPKSLIAIKRE